MYKIDYNKLKNEINRFVDLLKQIENSLIGFSSDECCSLKIAIIDKDEAEAVFKSMKSNATIMLYNLVEASVRSTMNDYYANFNSQHLSYSDTIIELKKLWIKHKSKNFNNSNMSEQVFEMIENSINTEYFISLDFDKDFSLSGNADVREIKSILEKHGLQYDDRQFNDYGGALKSIKDMRNRLAHGNVSFEENGKDLTVNDLEEYKKQTYQCVEYFMSIVNSSLNS